MSAPFEYPERVNYKPLYAVSKTRKSKEGFEAVAALFFMGVRQNMKTATGPTRAKAQRAAMKLIGC